MEKLEELQKKNLEQDRQILLIFEYLKQLELAKKDKLELKIVNRSDSG
jgi:hypothetical protein